MKAANMSDDGIIKVIGVQFSCPMSAAVCDALVAAGATEYPGGRFKIHEESEQIQNGFFRDMMNLAEHTFTKINNHVMPLEWAKNPLSKQPSVSVNVYRRNETEAYLVVAGHFNVDTSEATWRACGLYPEGMEDAAEGGVGAD